MTCRSDNHDGPVKETDRKTGVTKQGHNWAEIKYICEACGISWTETFEWPKER